MKLASAIVLTALALSPAAVHAVQDIKEGKLAGVYVSGGNDTPHPGVTCFRLQIPVSAACPYGIIAVPNNNQKLIATLLAGKALDVPVWVYYLDSGAQQHCPMLTFTPCVAVTVAIQSN